MRIEGLSSQEAARLSLEVGPNAIPKPQAGGWKRLAAKFWAPVPWMLEATAALEIALGKWPDAALVAAVLVLNAGIGFVQEGRARSALELLRSRLEVRARVLRDGQWAVLPAAGLVPHDVVHVRVGDFVPADLTVLDGEVLADQSALTGESVPVERATGSTLYSGTTVMRGEATGRVTATGVRTSFGRTAQLVGTAAPTEHVGGLVLRMVRVFIALDLVIGAAGTVYLRVTGADWDTVVSFAVVLLLASVPVALPAAFTLAGALGARTLAGTGILTTRLSVLQDAASMDLLCVDKTGTLTLNRLSVERVAAVGGTDEDTLRLAAAASDAATQDPIDLAILKSAAQPPDWKRTDFIPFDPATKRSEAMLATPDGPVRVTKGAPAAIAQLTGREPGPALEELAGTGARVLALATRHGAGDWRPRGLIALADSPRGDAQDLLDRLRALGVRTVMLTGDSAQTAAAMGRRLGMVGDVITAELLGSPDLDLSGVSAIAQVLPEHKYQLVRRFQQGGHTVGMTGDGVNDAPALRQAEVGIAVEGASDVAKAAAGAVLTRGGLSDIVALVEESRRIHQRSLTYALNVSVKKIEVPLLLALGVFAWREFVFSPLLMALLLLANDVVSMAVTTDRARPSRRPDSWQVGSVIAGAVIVALPMLGASAAILWVTHGSVGVGLDELRTVIFVTLALSSQATIYIVRTGVHAWHDRPSAWLLAATAADMLVLAVLALSGWLIQPITALGLVAVTAAVLAAALVSDSLKTAAFPRLRLHSHGPGSPHRRD